MGSNRADRASSDLTGSGQVESEAMDEATITRMTVETVQGPAEVAGRLLGQSSSEAPRHAHRTEKPRPGERCSACRWMRVTILFDEHAGQYVVVNEGLTRVPGETQRGRIERTTSPVWVIECLTRPDRSSNGRYIPTVSRKALAEAAASDAALAEQFSTRVG